MQRGLVGRVAEELVQRFFRLTQRGAQFVHHAAHGLAVADPAIQIFDPGFERFGLPAGAHMGQALRQPGGALGHVRVGRVQILVGGLEVQDGGCHLHRDRRARRLATAHGVVDGTHQGAGQVTTVGMQLQDGFADRVELLQGEFEPVGIPARHRRPGLGGGGNAFARLCQHRRIEPAELPRFVVDLARTGQAISLANRGQYRCDRTLQRNRIRTKEQVVLGQTVRHRLLATRQTGVLHQNPRSRALDIQVGDTQPSGNGLEKRRADLPEDAWLEPGLGRGEGQTQFAHGRGRHAVAGLHHPQDGLVDPGPCRRIIAMLRTVRQTGIDPAPLDRPQVGRMHTLTADQFEHITVLREQGHRRSRLALEHAFEVFAESKTGALDLVRRLLAAQLRPLHEFLRQSLHGAQQFGGCAQPHHLQRPDRLMQLLAGDAQLAGIELGQIRAPGQFSIAHKAPQRLAGTVQRLAQFVQHPGQRTQVVDPQLVLSRCYRVGLHGLVNSCQRRLESVQAILKRDTDCRNSSAMRDNSRTWPAVDLVPSPVCSVTAKICWIFSATTLARLASRNAALEIC